jgi:hypothetical protein
MTESKTVPKQAVIEADTFAAAFLSMEAELGLFDASMDGLRWWDTVRYDVFRFAYGRVMAMRQLPPPAVPTWRRAIGLAERVRAKLALELQLRFERNDVMVLRAPRQVRDGSACDIALDPVAACTGGRHLVINTYPHYYHLGLGTSQPADAPVPPEIRNVERMLCERIGMTQSTQALEALVSLRLAAFHAALKGYRRLLRRLRPRLVLLVQNGMEKALFHAAREAGALTVEAQHGLIGLVHPGYSYPRHLDYRSLTTLPDVFLVFSEHWARSCHYPAARTFVCGNDAFHVNPLPWPGDDGDVLFIAADIYHDVLLPLVRDCARRLPGRRFVYKLHPNMQGALEQIRRALADLPNVEVIPGSASASALLPRSSHVVLVQSTFALEALQAGRRVCIVPRLNYGAHRDILGLPAVSLTDSVDELLEALKRPVEGPAPVFFDRFASERTCELLEQLRVGTAQSVTTWAAS